MIKTCDCEPFNSCPDCRPDLSKPGLHIKKTLKTPYVKKREIEPPTEKHCRRCNRRTHSESYRHSESRIIKFLNGGGIMGDKIPDRLSGWMCDDCDSILSKTPPKNSSEKVLNNHALEWFIVIVKTHLI